MTPHVSLSYSNSIREAFGIETDQKKIGQRRCKILLNLLIFPTSIKSEICQESSFGMSNALVTNLTKVSEVAPRSDNLT